MEAPDDEVLEEDADVAISALEHYSYCPRQCALIHVEQTFDENLFTIKGHLAHERVHSGEEAPSRGIRVVRGAPLWSHRLGLQGKADVIEFHGEQPYPVEYKVGHRHGPHADVQLCAQALCLEEMLGVAIPVGAIFYHATRQRHEVAFDHVLRQRTLDAVTAVRQIMRDQHLPDAPNDARCPNCSLVTACLPSVVGERARLRGLQGSLFQPLTVGDDHA